MPIKLPGMVQFRKCTLTDKELAVLVAEGLNKMYDTGKIPSFQIPARPNEDFGLLVGELVVRFIEATGNDFE